MHPPAPPFAAVLLNLGGPESEAEVRPFLRALLGDPAMVPLPRWLGPLFARFVAWRRAPHAAARYRAIGGSSPVRRETAAQAASLAARLPFPVTYALRYSAPGTAETLQTLAAAGVQRVLALPLFPQESRTTTGTALAELARVAAALGLQWETVPSFPEAEGYLAVLAAGCRAELEPAGVHVLMVAHGLPERLIAAGDPYVGEVERSATALAARLPEGTAWSLAYQSRVGPVRWVGPHLDEELPRLAAAGVRKVVLVPLSFVCENLETLWDLDLEARSQAESLGLRCARVASPGQQPEFLDELGARLRARAEELGWGPRAAAPAGEEG